jgi:hypothetical protein
VNEFADYLHQRWNEGCHNASRLYHEIREKGYGRKRAMMARLVASWRIAGKPASPKAPQRIAPKHAAILVTRRVDRTGFRLYWRFRSRVSCLGRRRIDTNVFELVKRMARENPSWGAPKIHGELLKLGFEISERTVSRYLLRRIPSRRCSSALAGILEESPGSHRRPGLLHRANADLPFVVLLLRRH